MFEISLVCAGLTTGIVDNKLFRAARVTSQNACTTKWLVLMAGRAVSLSMILGQLVVRAWNSCAVFQKSL